MKSALFSSISAISRHMLRAVEFGALSWRWVLMKHGMAQLGFTKRCMSVALGSVPGR